MAVETLLFLLLVVASVFTESQNYPREGPLARTDLRLSRPLIGDDGRIYICSEKTLYAFESNGSIAWTSYLSYACSASMAPVHGTVGKLYLVAENRVLRINFSDVRSSPPAVEVFFGPEKGQAGAGDIIGLAASTLSSSVFINIKNRGLFAYEMHGKLHWTAGAVLYQYGYSLGCRKGVKDCSFSSSPVVDRCEASLYISNNAGELYSLSLRSPHFNWVQDLSSFDKNFTITPGNNGRLYVTVTPLSLVLTLDVLKGNILWQTSIGPLGSAECEPVVDSNGWVSIGSLDGFLYSISPTGALKKYSKASEQDYVIQVSPHLDCSGNAVYMSQTEMEEKVVHTVGESTCVSAMKPKGVLFTMLVPATGVIHWSESYPGKVSSLLSQSDLKNFVLDEGLLLSFIAASRTGKPLPCRSKHQKLLSTCSQAKPRHHSIYTGNERTILLFLLLESILLVILAGLVRFCCIFWTKKKLQDQGLGSFLEKRRSLQLKKTEFDRTITQLEKKAASEAVAHEIIEEIGDLVRERESISRKLSTTYSLGRDGKGLRSKSLLPVYDGKSRSYSFQSARKESVTIFHTLSNTSSGESSKEKDSDRDFHEENQSSAKGKGKARAPVETESSSDDDIFEKGYHRSSSEPTSSSKGYANPFFMEQELTEEELKDVGKVVESATGSGRTRSMWLKRRKTLS
ncbi:PREDICTED: protein GAMETE EXPRESSED 3 [Populus euphratica]|uniref:Protein GAMETE EXPRESSED 3 n=1 Tax=Populus euphratica TaxID=75702 RepID=A0AAJ6VG25_POPEU|nr:PREDICTED: protein GAMETE EXPRESSED 3 [Populus euphratica]